MSNSGDIKTIAVTSAEISSIQAYLQQKNTAVLTIMFTDLKGFTALTEQQGERYATEFRQIHDKLLTEVIEADGAGLIIKFIGDAVMAVFSEPSVAVERALKIQQRLAEFNAEPHDYPPMKVRIGLHMGQVSIANNLQADVFGRHVNRASRIESLADGGQIYLSYAVFDSAKGWLANNKQLCWQNHGRYWLKGIDEAIEIYEVIAKNQGKPKPPLHGKKQRSLSKWFSVIALLLAVISVAAAIFYYYQTPEVYFMRFYPDAMYLDQREAINLAGQKTDSSRKVLNEITRGKHLVHYAVTDADRFYAPLDINQRVNNIELKFSELRLPSIQLQLDSTERQHVTKTETFNYALYDPHGEKVPLVAQLSLALNSSVDGINKDTVLNQATGSLTLNNKVYPLVISLTHHLSANDAQRIEPVLLYQDDYHAYYYRYTLLKTNWVFDVYAVFKPLKLQ